MAARTIFVKSQKYANLCYLAENGADDFDCFFHQKMCNWYLGNYKKRGRKFLVAASIQKLLKVVVTIPFGRLGLISNIINVLCRGRNKRFSMPSKNP